MKKNKYRPRGFSNLKDETLNIAKRWIDTPYYKSVEKQAEKQWKSIIIPFLNPYEINYSRVLELAVGHGRMTQILVSISGHVTGVDVLQENIDICAERFSGGNNIDLLKNNGIDIADVGDNTTSFVFCFDSMIHFDSDVVRSYLGEFERLMTPGAFAFLHHSNLSRNPGGNFQRNAHARNFMSVELFSHYAQKEGLEVVKQKVIDWGSGEKRVIALDGLSLLRKPD